MDTSAIIVMVLAIVVVGTECRSPPRHPPPDFEASTQCLQTIRQCTSALQENPFISGQTTDYRTLIINIDQICEDYQQAATCIRSSSNTCHRGELQEQIDISLSVGDFLCSDHGKSLVRQFQESTCYHNPLIIYEIQGTLEQCAIQAMTRPISDISQQCQAIEETSQCIAQAYSESCGEATGELVTALFNRILPAITNQQCSYDTTNDALKRAFNLFKKSL